ncbi:MAG: hypothetical protein BYD32DRAFT_84447 [Podila humilis]|nr:MAG: hypothetical protein BYD32DRAFT_84447 [Podila humilis]
MVDELDLEFSQEIMARQGQLQDTQALLRHATRDLTETRQTIKHYREQAQLLAEAQQRIKNLEASLEEEELKTQAQKGFTTKLRNGDDVDLLFSVKKPSLQGVPRQSMDLATRERKAEEYLISLRARVYAYQKNDEELTQELAEIKGKSPAKELQCKKVIAICCDIPLEKVDDLLGPLTQAVESDGASLDLSRVAGFMSRVKQQEGMASSSSSMGSSGLGATNVAAAAVASAAVAAASAQ